MVMELKLLAPQSKVPQQQIGIGKPLLPLLISIYTKNKGEGVSFQDWHFKGKYLLSVCLSLSHNYLFSLFINVFLKFFPLFLSLSPALFLSLSLSLSLLHMILFSTALQFYNGCAEWHGYQDLNFLK